MTEREGEGGGGGEREGERQLVTACVSALTEAGGVEAGGVAGGSAGAAVGVSLSAVGRTVIGESAGGESVDSLRCIRTTHPTSSMRAARGCVVSAQAVPLDERELATSGTPTQFTCCTSTTVHILTQDERELVAADGRLARTSFVRAVPVSEQRYRATATIVAPLPHPLPLPHPQPHAHTNAAYVSDAPQTDASHANMPAAAAASAVTNRIGSGGGSSNTVHFHRMLVAASQGDEATVGTLLSMAQSMLDPQGFINCQNAEGYSALHTAAGSGHAGVTRELLAARCIVDLQAKVCLEAVLAYLRAGTEIIHA